MNDGKSVLVPLEYAFPAQDLLLGGGVLVALVLFHIFSVNRVSAFFLNATDKMQKKKSYPFQEEVILSLAVFALLIVHVIEILIWSAVLVKFALVTNFKTAAFFGANAYTTLGYGSDILPPEWKMMGPIIAISGLFTFGWTGSVLVNWVVRFNNLRLK